MTSTEIARELRATRPVAPPELRARVLADADRGPSPAPTLRERLRGRRLFVLVPAAASLAAVAAVAIAITSPGPDRAVVAERAQVDAIQQAPGTTSDLGQPLPEAAPGYGNAQGKVGTPATASDRAQRIVASLALRVEDGDALSAAVLDAVRITRSLDGYVVTSDVASGDTAAATLVLRVPSEHAQDAIARLSELGTIEAQRVQADDLQGTIDALGAEVLRLRKSLAQVRARLASEELTPEQRGALQARRDELVAQLRVVQGQRNATVATASEASIDVSLRTATDAGAIPPQSRLDRTLDRALDILAWEAVTVLGLVVVLAPLALALVALRLGRRSARRWSDTRTLGAA
jgi:hypothetical protein